MEQEVSGFFSNEQLTTKKRVATITGCGACQLHKGCTSPKMKPAGDGEKGILILGTCPSEKADNRNEPFAGEATLMLKKLLRKYGINLERDCVKIDAISCYPGNADITSYQVELCRPNVFNVIDKMKPSLIIALGGTAVESLIGHRFKKNIDGITKWRGWSIPDRDLNCWVCPTFHPTYVMQQVERNPSYETVFNRDIKNALCNLGKKLPYYEREQDCIEIISGRRVYDYLKKLNACQLCEFAFDYETTGLKPHAPGHEIISCAIAESECISKAFLMPKDPPTLNMLKKLLANRYVPKIAQNMKFEDIWTSVILGIQVQGWAHDTMLESHRLDNRRGISGLKFQAYVRFGIVDYDSEVSPFLKGIDEKNANSLNRIKEAPVKPLLYYNGMDSLLEYRLCQIQRREINNGP